MMMDDDAWTTGHGNEQTIHAKIRRMLGPQYESTLQRSHFELAPVDTEQLKSLQKAEAHPIPIMEADETLYGLAERGEERDILTRYAITVYNDNHFLDLACEPRMFYVREGYKELYQYVSEYWMSGNRNRVVLLGNAGTGKSWFQIYALKQLLCCDDRKFDILIRQVGSILYLIDLEEALVYEWKTDSFYNLSKGMKRTLYFFEPGNDDPTRSPLALSCPSLSTLSPNSPRIKEYRKRRCKIVYFWPWSSGELWAVIDSSKLPINRETFLHRYKKFGGVIRYMLGEDEEAEEQLEERLKTMDINILNLPSLDRETKANNVSGFLLCYDNRSIKGKDRFATKNLEFTSAYVEEQVHTVVHMREVKDCMKIVLNQLSGSMADISGKNLERAAMTLLSKARDFKWKRIEIGANPIGWEDYAVSKKRNIRLEYCHTERFHQPGFIIAPFSNRTLPVIDFVCSWPQKKQPVVAFQCTWRNNHGVSLKALHKLRREHMLIPDDQKLEIYMICPNQEDEYANMEKEDFLLAGQLNSTELQTMWENTKLFVIRPSPSWKKHITTYLSKH